jgi:signal transduction histidine kinase
MNAGGTAHNADYFMESWQKVGLAMPKRVIRILMLVFAIAAHGIAFLQLQRQIATLALPPEFGGQIAFLLLLSLFLALILPLSRNANFIWLILIIRGGILLLVNLPFGGYLESETLLLAALIIEAHYYTSLKAGLSYSIVLVILSVYCRLQPVKAWGVYMPGVALRDLWIYALYAGFITAFSFVFCFQLNNQVSLEELSRRLDEATSQLAQANGQLIEYAGIVEQEAIQNERKRFAREIHDALAYTLSNLAMMTEAAKDLSTGDRTVFLDHLTQMHSLAKMGAVEVRRAIQALRPVQLNEESGLAAVCRLVQAFNKATQIDVQLNLGNVPLFLGAEADLAVYRLVQEGMTNALRHGKATAIFISFSALRDGVCILIKDNGVGSHNLKPGYGLTGMRERIARLGGQLTVFNGQEGGFVLSVWIPVKGDTHEPNQSTFGG